MLTPQNLDALPWMPESCAYRVLHEGGELPTGIRLSVATATGRHTPASRLPGVFPEESIALTDLIDHITQW